MPMLALPNHSKDNQVMLLPNNTKNRYIFEENIFFNSEQICHMLGISQSCLSRQLNHILSIPGCEKAKIRIDYGREGRPKYHRVKLIHYNLNTVVAIAYRINNTSCKAFLDDYHSVINSLHLRISGPNYFIPATITESEFRHYAQNYCTPHDLEYED